MANKLLDMTLFYKGKRLNFAREGREIKSKFIIGSNINLFWEILDSKFPDKFEFLTKKGNRYIINLHSSMSFEVEENNLVLSPEELKMKKILSGNSIILNEKISGTVSFSEHYKISFRYKKPYLRPISAADKELIRKYKRRQEYRKGAVGEFIFIFGGLTTFMIILFYLMSQYEPPVEENILQQKIARAKESVQKIQFEEQKETPEKKKEQKINTANITQKKPESQKELKKIVKEANKQAEKRIQDIIGDLDLGDFGGAGDVDLNADTDFGAEILEANVSAEIVVSGSRGGKKRKVNKAAVADFNTSAVKSSGDLLEDTGSLSNLVGDADLGDIGDLGLGEMDLSDLGGVEDIKTKEISGSVEFAKVKASYAALAMVSEEEIDLTSMSQEDQNQFASIKNQVATYRSRLVSLYSQESLIVDMGGYLNITLYISGSGKVEGVDIERVSGSNFTDDFINKCRKLIMKWKFGVKKASKYQFRQKLQNI
ncbi:MAG: hypothetical protein CSB55_03700 [Candidatus Cloacimonadota bacterium]|nr:MAG: hypothetical protein CSB55_03700 [Candidatus Cloacimonadota bacterium]